MFLVDGTIYTPEQIATVMYTAIRSCGYWIDRIYVSAWKKGDVSISRADRDMVDSTALYAGQFEITVVADDSVNFVTNDDVQEALQILNENYPGILTNIALMRADPTEADVFFQLCVFRQVVYSI